MKNILNLFQNSFQVIARPFGSESLRLDESLRRGNLSSKTRLPRSFQSFAMTFETSFLFLSIAFLLFRTVPTILSGQFTFAFDMGRDLLWVRNMVELKKPALIGPWGSIAGVYFGPLWYYLLAIPYMLFNGDPRGAVVVPLASNIATLLIGWWFLRRKKHLIAANVWAVLYGFSPLVISISGFPFHANLLPLVTLIFLISLTSSSQKLLSVIARSLRRGNLQLDQIATAAKGDLAMTYQWLPLAALMASIAYHLEPAAGLMLTLYLGVWVCWTMWRNRNEIRHSVIRLFVYSFIAFSLPFIPQMVFEFRHDFIQTKALFSYFKGENESLGGVLPLKERIPERVTKFARTLSQSVLPLDGDREKWMLLGAFGVLGIFVLKKRDIDHLSFRLLLTTYYLLLFHYVAYAFLFPAELKNWYLFGFASVYLLAIALIVDESIRYLRLKVSDTFRISVAIILVVLAWFWKTANPLELIKPASSSPSAPETLRAQLEVVDWIYQDATSNGKPFSVYTYTPPIYDYTYQYLLWWRGKEKYQILPAEFSYQPGETSYLPEKKKFVSSQWKPEDAEIIYLILEPDSIESRREGWLGHYASLLVLNEIKFSSGVKVEIRQRTSIIDL